MPCKLRMHWNWLPDENVSKTLTFKWEDIFVDQNDVVSSFFPLTHFRTSKMNGSNHGKGWKLHVVSDFVAGYVKNCWELTDKFWTHEKQGYSLWKPRKPTIWPWTTSPSYTLMYSSSNHSLHFFAFMACYSHPLHVLETCCLFWTCDFIKAGPIESLR